MLKVEVRGVKQLSRLIRTENRRSVKALDTAIKVEGFRLRKQMMKEVRAGAPGGRRFKPMTYLARRLNSPRLLRNRPLALKRIATGGKKYSMADVIKYDVVRRTPLEIHVGWVGAKTSKFWKRLARMHQEGFSSPVSEKKRRYMAHRGAEIKKKSPRSRIAKYFFLRKSTTSLKTPGRPIIKPFWAMHEREAMVNIRNNFRLKLRGKRI